MFHVDGVMLCCDVVMLWCCDDVVLWCCVWWCCVVMLWCCDVLMMLCCNVLVLWWCRIGDGIVSMCGEVMQLCLLWRCYLVVELCLLWFCWLWCCVVVLWCRLLSSSLISSSFVYVVRRICVMCVWLKAMRAIEWCCVMDVVSVVYVCMYCEAC